MATHSQPVTVAPEVAQRIHARAAAGQLLSAICAAEHLDPGEVRAVLHTDGRARGCGSPHDRSPLC